MMESLQGKIFDDFGVAGIVFLASIIIAQVISHYFQKVLEKERFGLIIADRNKNLRRVPVFLRLFIITRGSLVAFNMLHFLPTSAKLVPLTKTCLALLGSLFLYFGLITIVRIGFNAWEEKSVTSKTRYPRLLINSLLVLLGLVIFLPELDFNIPKQGIIYSSAILFLINIIILYISVSFLEKKAPASITNKTTIAPHEKKLINKMIDKDPDIPIIADILALFLKVMKHHLRADNDALSLYKMISHDSRGEKYLFELEVRMHNSWKRRRITIGRLGGDSGSKSKCFYVIYDDYLVVKIPPEPVTDPIKYLDSIRNEIELARKIDLKACIVPSISVLLKYVDPAIFTELSRIESPEESAMISLNRHPENYQFLKIGNTFAYFMDMSKHYFLEKVIKTLHSNQGTGGNISFLRIKEPLEGIVANLLDLLAHINEKGVALRDLKPDNMLVAGDLKNFPNFLRKPDEYLTGLIDLETGVVFGNPPLKTIAQPKLGGTPRYATPSHFFSNELIRHIYDNTAEILHLQDWHGMTAVIYKTITTRHLFDETARLIPPITRKLSSIKNAEEIFRFAINASRHFWAKAEEEFKEKMAAEQEMFDELQIRISKPVASMFIKHISDHINDLNNRIRILITGRPLAPDDARKLLGASTKEIENFMVQCQKNSDSSAELQKLPPHTLKFLEELNEMKARHERITYALEQFKAPRPGITATLLFETMFSLVHRKMIRQEWQKIPLPDFAVLTSSSSGKLSENIFEVPTKQAEHSK